MKYLIAILVLLLFSCTKERPDSAREDVQVLLKSDTSLYTGIITEYYRVIEQKKFEERYEQGIKDGPYFSWFKNGTLKVVGTYENKRRVGVWNWYNQDGDLTYSFYYSKSKKY